jgi:hypothetical protein
MPCPVLPRLEAGTNSAPVSIGRGFSFFALSIRPEYRCKPNRDFALPSFQCWPLLCAIVYGAGSGGASFTRPDELGSQRAKPCGPRAVAPQVLAVYFDQIEGHRARRHGREGENGARQIPRDCVRDKTITA